MTLKEVYERELQIRKEAYEQALTAAIDLVEIARNRPTVSTHVGHNLAARAIEIAECAIRVDAAEIALRTIAEAEKQK